MLIQGEANSAMYCLCRVVPLGRARGPGFMGGVALQEGGDTGLPASSSGPILWAAVEHALVQGEWQRSLS